MHSRPTGWVRFLLVDYNIVKLIPSVYKFACNMVFTILYMDEKLLIKVLIFYIKKNTLIFLNLLNWDKIQVI